MSTNYAGSGSTVHTTIPLLDDADRPSAALWRQSFEPIIDSLAALDSGVSSLAIRTTGGTFTLSNHLTIDGGTGPFEWRIADVFRVLSGASVTVASGGFINVVSGGTIDLDGTLDIGGNSIVRSGVEFEIRAGATLSIEDNGIVTLAGDMTVTSSGNLFVDDLGLLSVLDGGVANVEPGGTLNLVTGAPGGSLVVQDGAAISVEDGGSIDAANGSAINVEAGAVITAGDAAGYAYDSVSETWRMATRKASPSGGWIVSGSSGVVVDSQADGDACYFSPDWNEGEVIDSITLLIEGGAGHASLPSGTNRLRIAVTTYNPSTGVTATIADRTDQSASTGAYEIVHVLEMSSIAVDSGSMPFTVQSNLQYTLAVFAEEGANAVSGTEIRSISGSRRISRVYGDKV